MTVRRPLEKAHRMKVIDAEIYEDSERKVECVYFREDHFGLRLTNKATGEVTKFGLSQTAAEKIADGFRVMLMKSPDDRNPQFIDEPNPEYHWSVAKD